MGRDGTSYGKLTFQNRNKENNRRRRRRYEEPER